MATASNNMVAKLSSCAASLEAEIGHHGITHLYRLSPHFAQSHNTHVINLSYLSSQL